MRRHTYLALLAIAAMLAIAGGALAGDYPVSGKWTYDNASDPGPATNCSGPRTMTFGNSTRQDTVGSVPQLTNKSMTQTGDGQYRVVDAFYNGQSRGTVSYSMHVLDPDHLQINYDKGGTPFGKGGSLTLRRCQ